MGMRTPIGLVTRGFRHLSLVRALALVIAFFMGVSVSACTSPTGATEFTVVTTTTQVTDFTREVIGSDGIVYPLLQANQSAHSFDPSARDLEVLSRADALVINGVGLEPWIGDAIAASGFSGVLIDASSRASTISRDGLVDPHIWTSPLNAQLMTQEIAQALATLNPDQALIYESNSERYCAKLELLNQWIAETLSQVPPEKRLLVTNHDAFTYFVDAYGITLVGSIIPEFDDNAEPSAADLDELIRRITSTGVQAIFAESSISPKLAQTVAAEAGITVYSGDDSLYSDTLGAPGSGADTYIGATIHNVNLLARAWGVTPAPVPTEIARG